MTTRKRLSTKDRVRIFELAKGVCHLCDGKITTGQSWEVSHAVPLEMGGADEIQNMFPAHKACHAAQTAKIDIPMIAKAKRRQARHLGIKKHTSRPMPGSRASGWKRKFNGSVERRS
jgi:5-methylcytosine-specific restriction protein A